MWSWLLHFTGADNPTGKIEAFWAGFGSDLGEFAVIGLLYQLVRRHNCHIHRCWRIGRHNIDGTSHIVCRQHHPIGAPSANAALSGQDPS